MQLLALAMLLLSATLGAGQEPVQVKVRLVNVDFSAYDARGTPLENLTKDDVEVFEDAVPQQVSFFAHSVDVPLTLGLILDVSESQDQFSKQHEHDLKVFLNDVLGPKDRVFLVCFANHIRLVSDFSPSGTQILQQLDAYRHDSRHFSELGPTESRDLGTAFYDSIFYSVTEKLAKESGRRALLIFSDGEDNETGGQPIDAETTDSKTYFRQITEELRSSYELAYYPSNPMKDDTFRKIAIRPKLPGVTVRSRTGYFARAGD